MRYRHRAVNSLYLIVFQRTDPNVGRHGLRTTVLASGSDGTAAVADARERFTVQRPHAKIVVYQMELVCGTPNDRIYRET